MILPLLARYWYLAVIAVLVGTTLWYRGSALSAESKTQEFEHAYKMLAQSTQRQAQAMNELEQKAAAAVARSRQARAAVAPKVDAAKRSADALAGALVAPRPMNECPANAALEVVREDLRPR